MKKTEPQNAEEVLFIRGLPFYCPRTAKATAFLLDNGGSKSSILKKLKKPVSDVAITMFSNFCDFYINNPKRAKELFKPYSEKDWSVFNS
jgi:hypothetical protein